MMTLSCTPGTSTPSALRTTGTSIVESSLKTDVSSRNGTLWQRRVCDMLRLLPSEHVIRCPAGGQNPRAPRECGKVPGTRAIPREWTRLNKEDGKLSEFTDGDHEAEVAQPSRKRSRAPPCPDDKDAR